MATTPDPRVRHAVPDDADTIGRLLFDFNTEFESPTPDAGRLGGRFRSLLARPDVLVALAENELGEPTLPRNVRIRRKSGEIVPVEMTYQGIDYEEGVPQHLWLSVLRYRMGAGDSVMVDEPYPPDTAIIVLTDDK